MALFEKIPESEKLFFNAQYAVKKQLQLGLEKAALRLIEKLEESSPDDKETSKNKYKRSWKINRRYKNMRIVFNSKVVIGKSGEEIPLSNILEIEKPHMRSTFDNLVDELADIIFNEIKF